MIKTDTDVPPSSFTIIQLYVYVHNVLQHNITQYSYSHMIIYYIIAQDLQHEGPELRILRLLGDLHGRGPHREALEGLRLPPSRLVKLPLWPEGLAS